MQFNFDTLAPARIRRGRGRPIRDIVPRASESQIGPQAFTASMCFSPDGKTLASGGRGQVDLWDVEPFCRRRRMARAGDAS
jgi:hypothetical protein